MYQCQQSLIKHLQNQFSGMVKTIEEYAGQLKEAHKVTQLCPAILVLYTEGEPLTEEPVHNFDLIVITRNRALNKKENKKNNLELVSQIADYLRANFVFRPDPDTIEGSYEILRDQVKASTLLNDNQFCIMSLSVAIKDYTI